MEMPAGWIDQIFDEIQEKREADKEAQWSAVAIAEKRKHGAIDWHPMHANATWLDELPGENEPVLITIETENGIRRVWMDAYLKCDQFGNAWFYTSEYNEMTEKMEENRVWYEVKAWAYPPEPYGDRYA